MTDSVLVVNSGSSSVKYQVIAVGGESMLHRGQLDRIGLDGGHPTHDAAIEQILADLPDRESILAVGHRVVHGGATFHQPELITDQVLGAIEEMSALAPLHNPANSTGIQACARLMPRIPQVAVFDTAFFHTVPAAASRYAIPRGIADEAEIRKYGFHGTSHQFIAESLHSLLGRPVQPTRHVSFHLGNGSSVAAIRDGAAIDTSMGLTPLAGLVMGTRSGDLDPSIPLLLQDKLDIGPGQVDDLLNSQSGLLGLTGHSDMREVGDLALAGDAHAREAIDIWTWRARHYLGAYIVHLGGVDVITFTGGIGENQPMLRARVLEGLEDLGIVCDPVANESPESGPRRISDPSSAVEVWVVPTNEELQIARLTLRTIAHSQ